MNKGKNLTIDAHVHVQDKPSSGFMGKNTSLKNLLNELDKAKVGKAVLLPIMPFVNNDFIGQICRQYPDRFIGFASVDFSKNRDLIKTLICDIKRNNLKGIKIHPRIQEVGILSKKVTEIVKVAADLKLPVTIDCFPQFSLSLPIEEIFPGRIGELARKVPGAKIIMAHAGGYKLWDAFFVAKANPNIYLEFSFSISYFKGSALEQDFGFILKKIGAKRCIYGSDHPAVSLSEGFNDALRLCNAIKFSSEEREFFFGGTVLSILPKC